MKRTFRFFSIGLMAFGLMFTQSCDKCKDVECKNGGTCESGTCTCKTGFSGTNCETEDKCLTGNVTCKNGGTCTDGICTCTTGYEGTDCSTESRAKFLGNYYSYKLYCGTGTQYGCTLSVSSAAINKITISNFNNKGWTVSADVSGSSFSIAPQTFTDGTSQWKVETTSGATLSGTTLTIPVRFTDTATLNTVNCPSFALFKY